MPGGLQWHRRGRCEGGSVSEMGKVGGEWRRTDGSQSSQIGMGMVSLGVVQRWMEQQANQG